MAAHPVFVAALVTLRPWRGTPIALCPSFVNCSGRPCRKAFCNRLQPVAAQAHPLLQAGLLDGAARTPPFLHMSPVSLGCISAVIGVAAVLQPAPIHSRKLDRCEVLPYASVHVQPPASYDVPVSSDQCRGTFIAASAPKIRLVQCQAVNTDTRQHMQSELMIRCTLSAKAKCLCCQYQTDVV